MSEPYHVRLTPPAARALYRLPPRIADAVIRFLEGPLAGSPQRVTKPLGQELSGLRSGYVGVAHRILVSIDEDQRVVSLSSIQSSQVPQGQRHSPRKRDEGAHQPQS
jgi:mRNA-degrading endonuclease RelE of RelBE toxin-antitoxin system